MTLANGGSPIFPLVVHQPASPSISTEVHSLRRGMSTNPGVTMWCVFYSELGKGATREAGKYLFRAANVWWMCAQYFVIASCG